MIPLFQTLQQDRRLGHYLPGGEQTSAITYSLIETAKENGLDPHRYLLWVFETAPQMAASDALWAEKLTPAYAPAEIKYAQ